MDGDSRPVATRPTRVKTEDGQHQGWTVYNSNGSRTVQHLRRRILRDLIEFLIKFWEMIEL